jgi:hypothetical protein
MKQNLRAGGAIDLLTKEELSDAMGHQFDAAIRDFYRGVDYLSFTGNGNNTSTFTLPDSPSAGYVWSVKLVSAQLSAAGQLSVYLSENNQTAPVHSVPSTANGTLFEAVARWSSEQLVIKDGRVITIYSAAGNILNWSLRVRQVPAEYQGKL